MTPEQKAAYINAQTACALAEIHGMVAENMQRAALGKSMAYGEEAFARVIEENCIHHNAVMVLFNTPE